jgi:TetR/AcrR family transcriptional repressor of nem operon
VRQAVTESLEAVLDFLARLTPGKSAAARREKAIALFASLVGALVAARAVNDPKLSQEILQALSRSLVPR